MVMGWLKALRWLQGSGTDDYRRQMGGGAQAGCQERAALRIEAI
jgi:hypothetical protein